MRIWILGLLIVFLVPVATVSAARTAVMTGTGTVSLSSSKIISSHELGEHALLVILNNTYTLTGVLSGKAVSIERDVIRNVTVNGATVMKTRFQGMAVFTGTLADKSGTLRISYEGRNNSTFISGQFVAFGGTGQLAGVHGKGSFSGAVNMPTHYTFRWTVTTHAGENETSDRNNQED